MHHTSGIRGGCVLLFLLLLAVVAPSSFGGDVGLPLERVMREFQARYELVKGETMEWPGRCSPCNFSDVAPSYPPDGFYSALEKDPQTCLALVQKVIDKINTSGVYSYFVDADSLESSDQIWNFTLRPTSGAVDPQRPDSSYLEPIPETTLATMASNLKLLSQNIRRLKTIKVPDNKVAVTSTMFFGYGNEETPGTPTSAQIEGAFAGARNWAVTNMSTVTEGGLSGIGYRDKAIKIIDLNECDAMFYDADTYLGNHYYTSLVSQY